MSEKGDSDEDLPQLSAKTFAALQEFYREEEEREHNINLLADQKDVTLKEDWQLSQFWYNQDTIDTLVKLTLKSVGDNAKIALVSCPSLYKTMKKVGKGCEITLYEYDKRFSSYGADYVFYDYKSPLSIPREKSDYYDIVLADPPFLSDECLTKTALTIRFLTKSKIVLCTGAIMEDLLKRLLDLRKTSFEPTHENNLANEFCCFTNFDLDSLL